MDRRLPSWISLNDKLGFKSPKPSSPRRVSDEDGLFPRTRNRSGSMGSSKQKSPPTSPKTPNLGEKRLPNNDFIMGCLDENYQIDTFVNRMIKHCKKPDTVGSLPDWSLLKQYIAKATDDELSPLTSTVGSSHNQHTFTSKNDYNLQLYQTTVLGQLCRFNMKISENGTTIIVETIHEVLRRCPQQIFCSQVYPGHTPLRDAACNPTMLPEVLELLMSYDAFSSRNNNVPIALLPDTLNLTPVDHLVEQVQMDKYNGTAFQCVQILLKYTRPISAPKLSSDFLPVSANLINNNTSHNTINEASRTHDVSYESTISPLIRILSLGTSFGSSVFSGSSYTSPKSSPTLRSRRTDQFDNHDQIDENMVLDQPATLFVNRDSGESTTESHVVSSDRLRRILLTVQMLLDWDPHLLYKNSCASDCTPLHIAIRNYGNYHPLISEIIDRDNSNERNLSQLNYRNKFGDLPLHVACSVGVPMDILKLVLQKTASVSNKINSNAPSGVLIPNSLIWSYNSSGYTPIDLEWIRHIEVGCSFHSHRPFYPIDSRGISQQQRTHASRGNGSRSDDMYYNLLRQAVDQVMKNQSNQSEDSNARMDIQNASSNILNQGCDIVNQEAVSQNAVELNNNSVGLLLQRIFLIICATFPNLDNLMLDDPDSVTHNPYILHQVCALSSPHNGPTLPLPVQELVLWKYPEQLEVKEPLQNKLPLHIALSSYRWNDPRESGASRLWTNNYRLQKASDEWKVWIRKLIKASPIACSSLDNFSRLPIHYALDWEFSEEANEWLEDTLNTSEINEVFVINDSVQDLIAEYPHALETLDPVTQLFPFQAAATNPLISLNTVYHLLRCWPSGVTS